jgi:hypothetical protein
MMQTANDIAGFAGQQPRLKRDKGDGMSGMDNRARRRPRLRIQAGGISSATTGAGWAFARAISAATFSRGALCNRYRAGRQ